MNCPSCNGEISATHKSCPSCGAPAIIAGILSSTLQGIQFYLSFGFILFLVRVLFKNTWVAIAALAALLTATLATGLSSPITSISIVVSLPIAIFAYFRFGLLASVAGYLFIGVLDQFPITTRLSVWYSGIGLTGLALLLAFVLYAFHRSLGGQPLFGRASLED